MTGSCDTLATHYSDGSSASARIATRASTAGSDPRAHRLNRWHASLGANASLLALHERQNEPSNGAVDLSMQALSNLSGMTLFC